MFHARMVKSELQRLESILKERDPAGHNTAAYILYRLWPELEASIEQELPRR